MADRHAYIVDDDAALRRTVGRMLADAGMNSEGFETAEAFLRGYSDRPLGCVLLDVRLPGIDGLELLERIANLVPPNPVIMLSGHGDIPSAVRAVKRGAIDFLQKPFHKAQLLEAIEKAFEEIETMARTHREFATLTPREREVLMAFKDGAPNKVVAWRLDLSPRTVEMHRARILKKLGVTNLTAALLRARNADLIH